MSESVSLPKALFVRSPGVNGAIVSASTTIERVDCTALAGRHVKVKNRSTSANPCYVAFGATDAATITDTAGTTLAARPDELDPGESAEWVVEKDRPWLLLECDAGTASVIVQER